MPHAVISYENTEHQPANTALNLIVACHKINHLPTKAKYQTQFTPQKLVRSQDTNTITTAHRHHQTSPRTYYPMATKTIYYGCQHEPDLATSLTGLNLGDNFQVDTTSNPGLSIIIHPRWCSNCLGRREEEIRRHYNDRKVFPESANKEKARQERQHNEYRRGVIEGRIRGLRAPLIDTGQHNTANLNRTGQAQAKNGVEDRLVAMMGTQSLNHFDENWNWEQVGMEQLFQDHRHFTRGVKDGRKLQVQLESKALRIQDEKQREEFLENALM